MEKEFIEKIRLEKIKGNSQEVLKLYNLYFKVRNKHLPINEFHIKLATDFLDIIIERNKLDISKSNQIYLDYWAAIEEISTIGNRSLSQYLKNVKSLKLFKLSNRMPWGIHEGETLNEIMITKAGYILRCILHFEHFAIEDSYFLLDYIQTYPEYLKAIEVNKIKQLVIESWQIDDNFWEQ